MVGAQVTGLSDLARLGDSLPASPLMPVLFLGHGSPMNAIEENIFVQNFREQAKLLPTPKAILCVSAHWFTKGTKVLAVKQPETIHDFGGFPKALFDVQYPAPGNPELAAETAKLLDPTHVEMSTDWGFDHGSWSVIKHFYPEANIPMIQLSIDYTKEAQYHYDLAKRLAALRKKGVLIVGSGNIIHNLRLVDFRNINTLGFGFDWAQEAHQKVGDWLRSGNFNPLIDYRNQGTSLQLAAPTPDHFLPLIYALALKGKNEDLHFFNDYLLAGSLSMTSILIK